ncbi:hypothetical protein [Bordetella pertussis]|uniref:hypothetical protein n=1 Tax=Bordetella pertussis TaxID=520 RepID=UPI0011428385|nr:hypothetical protein [Bordetella pertussis]
MNWGVGDFQFLKSGSDEPCIQPIESSHLDAESAPQRSRYRTLGGTVRRFRDCPWPCRYVNRCRRRSCRRRPAGRRR